MAGLLKLMILTPDKQFYKGEVKSLKGSNADGSFEILPRHMPLITVLQPAVTEFTDITGEKHKAFTSTGILRVKDNEIVMLCDACEWPEEVDKNRAEEARQRAEKRLKEEKSIDKVRAELARLRAITRLKISSH